MSGAIADQGWGRLASFSETFTCYSAAIAGWIALADEDWARQVNPGLHLTLTEVDEGLFGFAYFPADFRMKLQLVRSGAETLDAAIEEIRAEVDNKGRVIVAGDAFHLPWHVAFGRRHLPHWYVVQGTPDELLIVDAFAARNELGTQAPIRRPVTLDELRSLLPALPVDDEILNLRERLAFGDDAGHRDRRPFQWFKNEDMGRTMVAPHGLSGPAAIQRLASHFHTRGDDPLAYGQADDIWSIGRHRAFLARCARETAERINDSVLMQWSSDYVAPLAARWAHIGPLLMQARLAVTSGRRPSASVRETLLELADREEAAAKAFPVDESVGRLSPTQLARD